MKCILALILALSIASCTFSPDPVPYHGNVTASGSSTGIVTSGLGAVTDSFQSATSLPPATMTPRPSSPTVASVPIMSLPVVLQHFPLRELPGVGRSPNALMVMGKVYVVNTATNNVGVIQDGRVTKYIPVGKRPGAIAADASKNRVFVANEYDKTVSLIVDDEVKFTKGIGDEARSLLYAEDRLFVGLDSTGTILVLDPATLQTRTTITLPDSFTVINLAFDSARHRLYANAYHKVVMIDSTNLRVLSTIQTKDNYNTLLAFSPANAIITNMYDSKANLQYLVTYDATTGAERARVQIGSDPRGAVQSADGKRLYIANAFTNNVSVIDPQSFTLVATIPVGLEPVDVGLDEAAHRLYVANYYSDDVSVVDTDSLRVVGTIPTGMYPTALVGNEGNGRMYISNASTDSVFVVEGNRVVKEIPVGHHPIDMARDDQANKLYVANAADRTLSIIDESDYSVRATKPITNYLAAMAVDPVRSRIYAGDVVLDLNSLSPIGELLMHGGTVGSLIPPNFLRVNRNNNRVYVLASNGTPGSNSRSLIYSVDGNTMQQRTTLTLASYGSTTAMTFDPETNRVFIAGTHPIVNSNELAVYDGNDNRVASLSLSARTTAMLYNSLTHHIFLAHATGGMVNGQTPIPANDLVQVIDANSLGIVARLTVNTPREMGIVGNYIYVASRDTDTITIIQDANSAVPPSPTATFTPTPWPTWTATPLTRTPLATSTNVARATPCAIAVAPVFVQRITAQILPRLGCPSQPVHSTNAALQPFERGFMIWREDEHRIYVFSNDKTWSAFDDNWSAGLPEDACPAIGVGPNLIKPKRGFGKVWCDESSARAKIGAATSGEYGYSANVQGFDRGQVMSGDRGQGLMLYADGKWE